MPRQTPWVVMSAPEDSGSGWGGITGRPRRAWTSPSCSSNSCSLRSASACTWRRRRRCSALSSGAKAKRRAAAAICCCTDTSRSRASRANSYGAQEGWDRTKCWKWTGTGARQWQNPSALKAGPAPPAGRLICLGMEFIHSLGAGLIHLPEGGRPVLTELGTA